jgi:hypothetical protein
MSVDEGWEHSLGLDQKKHEREASHAFTDLGHVPPSEPGEPRLGLPKGPQYAGSVATREELKAEVERIGRDHGHTLGTWLDLGHASQLGCLGCDRYAFVQVLPPPGQAITEAFEQPCPERGRRLIETAE